MSLHCQDVSVIIAQMLMTFAVSRLAQEFAMNVTVSVLFAQLLSI